MCNLIFVLMKLFSRDLRRLLEHGEQKQTLKSVDKRVKSN